MRGFEAVGEPEGFVEAIEWLAVAAAAGGNVIPALRLFGATSAAREARHLPPRLEIDEQRVEPALNRAMRAAGADALTALAQGRSLSLEQARDEALELTRVAAGPTQVDP